MSTQQREQDGATDVVKEPTMSMRLEVAVIPVTDVSRALHLTPPGSDCSIHFGRGITPAAPGSAHNYLVVSDLEQACADLISRGVEVSEIYHNVYDAGVQDQADGPDPEGRSYASFASFSDPDGNGWVLQEVQVRLPGR
jgi:hypothetical protein